MAYIKRLVVFLLFLLPAFSWAGYAQLTPPPSWSAGTGAVVGAGGAFNASQAVAANAATLSAEGTVLTNASLNVGGRAVTVPAAMRFAANAPRFAAAAIFLNPYVRLGIGVATWLGAAKIIWDEASNSWKKITEVRYNGEYAWHTSFGSAVGGYEETREAACASLAANPGIYQQIIIRAVYSDSCQITYVYNGASHNDGAWLSWVKNPYYSPDGGGFRDLATSEEFETEIVPFPMPVTVPQEIPAPLPVELPKINPVPSPDGDPAPMRIPTGDPVKLPNPDPANQPDQYRKPAIDVVPSPVPGEPWRVDIQPKDVISSDPNKLPENAPVPSNPPSGGDGGDKTQEKVPGFCETNPNSIVCKELKFDKPESDELKKKDVSVQVTPDSGWGGNGQCPAAKTVTVSGQTFEIPFDMICGFLGNIRPVIIAMAWLSALGIMIGGFRESSAAR